MLHLTSLLGANCPHMTDLVRAPLAVASGAQGRMYALDMRKIVSPLGSSRNRTWDSYQRYGLAGLVWNSCYKCFSVGTILFLRINIIVFYRPVGYANVRNFVVPVWFDQIIKCLASMKSC